MSKGLKKAGKIIGGIEDWMVIVLFTAMVVVTMAIVLCRYVFKVQFVPGEEIARYLMIWCGYAGAAMGFRTHAHVGVVVFAEKFPKSWQPVIIKIRHIISTAIVAILFLVSCNCLTQYMDSGKLTTATHIPTAVVYLVIPISMALAIVHTIVDIKEDFAPAKTETAESEGAEL